MLAAVVVIERKFSMFHLLLVALGAGAIVAATGILSSSTPSKQAAVVVATNPDPVPSGVASSMPAGVVLDGVVLELLDAPGYTYVRVGAKGTEGTWTAVATAKLVVGQTVRIRGEVEMQNFPSPTLKRSFPSIWFGTLAQGATGDSAPPTGPTTRPASSQAAVEVKPVARAVGGKTVAEILAQRKELDGKTVRVRGTVVKSNPNILGRTYLHVRDGSGDASTDLSITTQAEPKVGDTMIFEGVVHLDRDLGGGYSFPTILEEAKVVSE